MERSLDSGCWVQTSHYCSKNHAGDIICKTCWKETSEEEKEKLKREYNKLVGSNAGYQLYCSQRGCWQAVSKRNTVDNVPACAQHLGGFHDSDSEPPRCAGSAASSGMSARKWARRHTKGGNEKQTFNEQLRSIEEKLFAIQRLLDSVADSVASLVHEHAGQHC